MNNEIRRRIIGLLLVFAIIAGCCTSQAQSYFALPPNIKLTVGDELKIKLNLPEPVLEKMQVYVTSEQQDVFRIHGDVSNSKNFAINQTSPVAINPGKVDLQLRLFGLIPLKNMTVDVLPKIKLIPGGHSIGVMLRSQGVMVIGQSAVVGADNKEFFPAREAGIQTGDVILEINNRQITTDDQVAELIDMYGRNGQPLIFSVKRGDKILSIKVNPVYCEETGRYRIGLYIRDSAAGVGTLTFCDPITKQFGALGHVINDMDTNQKINIEQGKIISAAVEGIQAGKKGQPGEKIGMFLDKGNISGTIEKNTKFGIFGTLTTNLNNPLFQQPLPIVLADQIKTGPAEILTVVDGERIERFSIKIERLFPYRHDGKNMIIKITDPKLLSVTGGIIQGMSGSPIIQDGNLIGAVTHVFINDPSRGYGILIEKMLSETSVVSNNKVSQTGKQKQFPGFYRKIFLFSCL